jgi:DNA-binding IclR family transcriptional regulator
MKTNLDDNKGAMLVLNLLEVLCGYATSGAKNIDLATALDTSASNVTRTIAILISKGWARKSDNGRFYPTPEFTTLAFRVLTDFERAEAHAKDAKRAMTGR